jgi:sugar phosphate permease
MFARAVSRWLDRWNVHYAWVVLSVVFLTMLVSSAALGLPGAFMRPFGRDFGWTTAAISSTLAVRFVLYGLLGPFAAVLIERYGLRRIVCSALCLVACGLMLATRMTAIWQLFLLWGVLLGVGSGLTALVMGATVANRWFQRSRGLALGILTASSATGQLIFLPLVAGLIERYGWRTAVFPSAVGCAAIALLAWCLLCERPEDIGRAALGERATSTRQTRADSSPGFNAPFKALLHAARQSTFWVLAGTFFVCGLSTSGLIQTHFISLCGDYGLAAVPAASVLAMIGGFDFIGTIMSGWLSDRFDNRKLLFWYYGLRGLSLLWLPHSAFTWYGLSLFAVFYGLDWVATVPPHRQIGECGVRSAAKRNDLRLDFCRTPTGQRGCGVRCRIDSDMAANLHTGRGCRRDRMFVRCDRGAGDKGSARGGWRSCNSGGSVRMIDRAAATAGDVLVSAARADWVPRRRPPGAAPPAVAPPSPSSWPDGAR